MTRICTECNIVVPDGERFCSKCGRECTAPQPETAATVFRKKENAETDAARSLLGDKNILSNSHVVGKQEHYEASNITIHNNITEDHSHTTVVCALSGKRIYLDHSVECPACHRSVSLEYYHETTRRCEACEQEARERFRDFAEPLVKGGGIDAQKKSLLETEANRLAIETEVADEIVRSLHRADSETREYRLSSIQQAELESAVHTLVGTDDESAIAQSLDRLALLHEHVDNFEVDYWHFLSQSVYRPAEAVAAYEHEVTDSYWQRYWGFLAYAAVGSVKSTEAIDRLQRVFGDREDDLRMAEIIYLFARGYLDSERSMIDRALAQAAEIRRDYLSKPLSGVYATLCELVEDGGISLRRSYTDEEKFVLFRIFHAQKRMETMLAEAEHQRMESERAQREETVRREEARRLAEAERRRKEEEQQQRQHEMAARQAARIHAEMSKLQASEPAPSVPGKAFLNDAPKPRHNIGKRVLIISAIVLVLLIILFLIPAPEGIE